MKTTTNTEAAVKVTQAIEPSWHNAETCIENMQIAYDDALEADPFDDGNTVPTDTVVDAGDLGVLIDLARYAVANRHRLAAEQSRASTPAVGWEEREAIERSIRATEYKYFGDYEMSGDQREAVEQLVLTAQRYLALHPPVMGEVEAENARLREALKPFAKAGSIAGERNPYGDFYAYRPAAGDEYAIMGDHLRAAHAALATLSTEQVR